MKISSQSFLFLAPIMRKHLKTISAHNFRVATPLEGEKLVFKVLVFSKFDHAKLLLNSKMVELQRYTMMSQLLKVAEFSNFQRCGILQFPELLGGNLK